MRCTGTSVSSAYNEESTLRLHGMLDVDALREALQELVSRHEALRTTIVLRLRTSASASRSPRRRTVPATL